MGRTAPKRVVLLASLALAAGAASWLLLRGSGGDREVVDSPDRTGAAATSPPPAASLAGRPDGATAKPEDGAAAPEPVAPPRATGTLLVTVTSLRSGAPLAGAEVRLREDDRDGTLARSTTDAAGLATFEGLAPDRVEVITRAPGHVPGWTAVSDLHLPGARAIPVALDPGVSLAGAVRAAGTRRAIAGARVEARKGGSIGGMSSAYAGPPLQVTETDAHGRFRVEGIPLREVVTLEARAPGFVEESRSLMLGDDAERHPEVELLLEEAASVAGRVTGPDGAPVAGAEVRAIAVGPGGERGDLAGLEARLGPWGFDLRVAVSGTTGEDGRYALDGLRVRAEYRFFARANGFARSVLSDPARAATAPGEHLEVDHALRRVATLRVRVVGADGAPLENAEVTSPSRGTDLSPEREDVGVFRFDLLPPGEYPVLSSCPGFVAKTERVAVREGEAKEVRHVLEHGAVLEGTVVDDLGRPIPGASVSATPTDRVPAGSVRGRPIGGGGGSTDSEGRFRIEGLEAGAHRVVAGALRHGRAAPATAHAPGEALRLVLRRAAALRLRLVPPAGAAPPTQVNVSLEEVEIGGGVGNTRAWKDGRIVVDEVAPVAVRLTVSADGFAPVVREVAIEPAEDRDLGDVALGPGAELAGTVADANGDPLPGARVRVLLPGFMDAAVGTAGSDGRFRVSRLPTGPNAVRVEAKGFLEGRETVVLEAGATTRAFTLVPPTVVRGTVRDVAGNPATGVRVVLLLQREVPPGVPRECSAYTEDSGVFDVTAAAGLHVVEVRDREDRVLLRRDGTLELPTKAPLDLSVP